jgi:thiol:disulfide interchange protein
MGKKILGVILLTLAVFLAFPCLIGIMRLAAGLMSILFYDPMATTKITPANIGSTVVLSALDITLLVYGSRLIKKPELNKDAKQETEKNSDLPPAT